MTGNDFFNSLELKVSSPDHRSGFAAISPALDGRDADETPTKAAARICCPLRKIGPPHVDLTPSSRAGDAAQPGEGYTSVLPPSPAAYVYGHARWRNQDIVCDSSAAIIKENVAALISTSPDHMLASMGYRICW